MGFRDIKQLAIRCLQQGAYDHEIRGNIDVKNLFATGQVDENWVIDLIRKTGGDAYQCCPHHQDVTIDVHILRPWKSGCYWYVKFYFIEPDIIFISVHQ
ncbi:hypothetical protein [Serratia quinivorans]|jgi:hypothetical protein|uniref:hypothetical protein n=1 Tax=Serratia quinivorans TaxID=137545 RepID=UPI00217C8BB6|nr:hypothetical protein [Serratia quinivorans]CAI0772705.1 Uncharacterised protein [Serratia quinivorans]CAI0882050.1 Uncharacterised protein [Serratia quinivorans]CAI0908122.1 Uncharacterised protein [Serratia quinivorans]CAI2088247.1 Uncharacterised protein [Serratia quinivorans]